MKMIVIIDYGCGNLASVKNALDYLAVDSVVSSDPKIIEKADRIIFPGVGNFGYMMKNLVDKGLDVVIKKSISDGVPFFGICLGLQALFEESEESLGVKGLGVFKGKVVKFNTPGLKVPQIGWNKVKPTGDFFYFVNSYYCVPEDDKIIYGKTVYGKEFVSMIKSGNVMATQFHPEKSGKAGLGLLKRWIKC